MPSALLLHVVPGSVSFLTRRIAILSISTEIIGASVSLVL